MVNKYFDSVSEGNNKLELFSSESFMFLEKNTLENINIEWSNDDYNDNLLEDAINKIEIVESQVIIFKK